MTKPKQTKIAKVQALLERQQGARLDAICKATGWQPHSVRAALSGLRKAGFVIERTPDDKKTGASVYHIIPASEAAS
jgi:hypothetical protein